jgi:hypothetical protein
MKRLSEDEYLATMGATPRRVLPEEPPPVDFWPYFDQLTADELDGHDFSEGRVTFVWEMPGWQHVLVDSEETNTFLVLVLNLDTRKFTGTLSWA